LNHRSYAVSRLNHHFNGHVGHRYMFLALLLHFKVAWLIVRRAGIA
jgi:hypothetical protein